MTREEVKALSDEELQARAAELAGWKCVPCAAECATNIAAWPWMRDDIRGLPPGYPYDIAAAMELWDVLLERGYTVEMFSRREGAHAVTIGFPYDGGRVYSDDIEESTQSLAITRAFVLAMTQEAL